MFGLIKNMSITFTSLLAGSLAYKKCIFLNNEPFIDRSTDQIASNKTRCKSYCYNMTAIVYFVWHWQHILYGFKRKFGDRECNLKQQWNNYKCRCDWKNSITHRVCKKNYIWNPGIFDSKIKRCLTSIIDIHYYYN